MENMVNIIGEFRDKEIEQVFRASEIRKGLRFIRCMIVISGLIFLLMGITDFLYRKDIGIKILDSFLVVRAVIFIIGVILFVVIKRINNTKIISRLTCIYASAIYVLYFCSAFYFIPLQIMSPTFSVIIISTSLFMMPNRWIVNTCMTFAYVFLFILIHPYLTTGPVGSSVIAMIFLCWNSILLSTLFYNINVYKRNYFSKAYQLEIIANTDQLTQIHNRKSCDDILENKCIESTTFSIIMFDIDNFKLINDTYGHVAGDEVIVSITDLARKLIRKDDILARWGGEEFVILTFDAKLNEAEELAKRLKEQLTFIEHQGIKETITCSFGVTTYAEGDNVKSIIRRADQLLYLAKEHGKNRVVAG